MRDICGTTAGVINRRDFITFASALSLSMSIFYEPVFASQSDNETKLKEIEKLLDEYGIILVDSETIRPVGIEKETKHYLEQLVKRGMTADVIGKTIDILNKKAKLYAENGIVVRVGLSKLEDDVSSMTVSSTERIRGQLVIGEVVLLDLRLNYLDDIYKRCKIDDDKQKLKIAQNSAIYSALHEATRLELKLRDGTKKINEGIDSGIIKTGKEVQELSPYIYFDGILSFMKKYKKLDEKTEKELKESSGYKDQDKLRTLVDYMNEIEIGLRVPDVISHQLLFSAVEKKSNLKKVFITQQEQAVIHMDALCNYQLAKHVLHSQKGFEENLDKAYAPVIADNVRIAKSVKGDIEEQLKEIKEPYIKYRPVIELFNAFYESILIDMQVSSIIKRIL